MKKESYKGYAIQTINGRSYIYGEDEQLKGCTRTDDGKENSAQKAKDRIDAGKVNMLSEIKKGN